MKRTRTLSVIYKNALDLVKLRFSKLYLCFTTGLAFSCGTVNFNSNCRGSSSLFPLQFELTQEDKCYFFPRFRINHLSNFLFHLQNLYF